MINLFMMDVSFIFVSGKIRVYDDADGLKALNARLIKVKGCDRRGRIALTLKQRINRSTKDRAFHAV